MAYGWGMQTLAFVCAALFGIPSAILAMGFTLGVKQEAGILWVTALFGGVSLWALGTFIDGLFRRLEWTETDVTMRTWRGKRQVKWRDIERLEYRSFLQYCRIALPGGAGFGFVKSMGGAHAFVDSAVRRGIPVMHEGKPVSELP